MTGRFGASRARLCRGRFICRGCKARVRRRISVPAISRGFSAARYNPVVLEFVGESANRSTYRPGDPHGGILPGGRFAIADTALAPEMTLDRLNTRARLLDQFDEASRHLDRAHVGHDLDRFRQLALSVTTSPRLRQALDLEREPIALRDRYGQHVFGQGALQARRLIEAGARVVSVQWDEFGLSDGSWDTHERQTTALA